MISTGTTLPFAKTKEYLPLLCSWHSAYLSSGLARSWVGIVYALSTIPDNAPCPSPPPDFVFRVLEYFITRPVQPFSPGPADYTCPSLLREIRSDCRFLKAVESPAASNGASRNHCAFSVVEHMYCILHLKTAFVKLFFFLYFCFL
jgi:hypothetical protein